jgi:WD40 repeat protein
VWDLSTRVLISRCRDVHQDTLVLAFSPDGVLLAAGGRYWPRLFDVRTGRLALVLNNTAQYWQTGLAFNPDGRRLAVAGVALFGSHGGASVHELARGRGILELRGLSAPPGQIRFSAAGGHCAALSHSWEVGVWDVESGRMLCRGAGPQGLYPNDHAALALDATASRVAAAAGKRAKVWNARTGELLREYELPPGLGDALAFHPSGKLLLVRFETADADRYPIGTIAPREQHPRVIRVRELPDHGPPWLLHEFADLPWHVFGVDIAPDGRVAVADGLTGPGPADARLVVLDPLGGKRLWSAALDKVPGVQFHLDPAGESLWYADRADNKGLCVDPRTGIPLDPERRLNMHYGPGGRFAARVRGAAPFGMDAWSHRGTFPPIHLDVDHHDFNPVRFDPTGNRVAWGRQDGGILVADLPEVGRRLATIDLAR